jgi:hypothetical protein
MGSRLPVDGRHDRPSFLCFAYRRRGESGACLLELTATEQRFDAVMEVLRDRLTVIEVALL